MKEDGIFMNLCSAKQRNSALELLRIICILLIICHHYSIHGGFGEITHQNINIARVYIQIPYMWGDCPKTQII